MGRGTQLAGASIGTWVVGLPVVGASVEGALVVGRSVVGRLVLGLPVVGVAVDARQEVSRVVRYRRRPHSPAPHHEN